MIRNIIVKDRVSIQTYSSDNPYVIISVTDPQKDFPKVRNDSNLVDILRLRFTDDDIKPLRVPQVDDLPLVYHGVKLFARDDATRILNFIDKVDADNFTIVCQCDAGISRSSGIAAALFKIFAGDDSYIFKNLRYVPNMLVYRTILDVYYTDFRNVDKKEDVKKKKSKVPGLLFASIVGVLSISWGSVGWLIFSIYLFFRAIVLYGLAEKHAKEDMKG